MAYVLISDQGAVTSWGATNQNATILSNITPASGTINIFGDPQVVSGLTQSYETSIPGLKSSSGTIGGYMGATPYIGSIANIAYSAGGYALHVYEFEATLRTTAVHELTQLNHGSEYKTFRPGSFTWSMRAVCGVDNTTAIVAPPDTGASLPTLTMTYGSGATLAGSAIIRQSGVAIVRGQKQLATFDIQGTSTLTTVSGIFGSSTLGSTFNTTPLWAAGGAATGALVLTAAGSRMYSVADSFWTEIKIRGTPAAPVRCDINWQGTGAVTIG